MITKNISMMDLLNKSAGSAPRSSAYAFTNWLAMNLEREITAIFGEEGFASGDWEHIAIKFYKGMEIFGTIEKVTIARPGLFRFILVTDRGLRLYIRETGNKATADSAYYKDGDTVSIIGKTRDGISFIAKKIIQYRGE